MIVSEVEWRTEKVNVAKISPGSAQGNNRKKWRKAPNQAYMKYIYQVWSKTTEMLAYA